MTDVEQKPSDEITPKETPENGSSNGTSDKVSKLEADVIRQMEYYFGDSNLQRDKFLIEQIGKNEDGWVPFSVLLTFKRLASLTTNVDEIVNAIMKSDEGLLEVSEDKLKVRRHPERPIPEYNEEKRKEIMSRTAYVKGFPLDSEMADLITYFDGFEKVVHITMRKYIDKPTKTYKFKGSCFVTFDKKEQCEDFIGKEKVEYKERELLRKWQDKYIEEKREESKNKNKKSNKRGNKKDEEEKPALQLPKGALIHFDGVTDETLKREVIKEELENLGAQVAFIEYNKGDKSGHIRLSVENSAKTVLEKLEDNKLKLKDTEVELTLKLVEGEEEDELLKKAVDSMQSRRNNSRQHSGRQGGRQGGRHHGGSGGGHHHNNRKRRGHDRSNDNETDDIDNGADEPPAKQEKEAKETEAEA